MIAAAVAAVAVGGVSALRDSALPTPLPPGESTTPTPGPSGTTDPEPTKSVTPPPATPVSDPITKVKWLSATIDIPRETGCPTGDVRFRAVPDDPNTGWSGTGWPRIYIHGPSVAYGDLTGDEKSEAVLIGSCLTGPEDSGDGAGRLLVVRREPDGKLTGVAWVGQSGAMYNGQWVADRRLYTDTAPWHVDWGYALGEARGYEWRGDKFAEVDVRNDYPGLIPTRGRPATPVDLSPVVDRLKCAAGKPVPTGPGMTRVRFDAVGRHRRRRPVERPAAGGAGLDAAPARPGRRRPAAAAGRR